MFKKFDEKEDVSGTTQLKSSVQVTNFSNIEFEKGFWFLLFQKGIRKRIIEDYPHLEPYMESLLPKKVYFKSVSKILHFDRNINPYR